MGEKTIPLQHFDLRALAKSLKLTSIDVIKTSNMDIESHWFQSLGPADLYFWKAEDRIVKQQISFFDQVIEWNEFDGVKTGFVNDDPENETGDVICFDQFVNDQVVGQAIEFLSNTEHVEPKVLSELISHYRFYNRWQKSPFMRLILRVLRWIWK